MTKTTKKQKKMQEMLEGFTQPASAVDSIKKLKEISKEVSKFNETVECHMRLGIDVRQADQQIRSEFALLQKVLKQPKQLKQVPNLQALKK